MSRGSERANHRAEERKRRARLQAEANEHMADSIRRGFITVVRIRRDGGRVIRWSREVDEWWVANAEYCMARDDGAVTEAHRKRVREAWLAIKDRVELSSAEQELIDEVMRFQ
jgi:hypothetical protein